MKKKVFVGAWFLISYVSENMLLYCQEDIFKSFGANFAI